MAENNGGSIARSEGDGAAEAGALRDVIVLRPTGLGGLGGARRRVLRVDHGAGLISMGRTTIALDQLRHVELRLGVLGVSDGENWICIDTHAYRDARGALARSDGSLSESFSLLLHRLSSSVSSARPIESFSFHGVVRLEIGSILISCVMLAILFGFYFSEMGDAFLNLVDFRVLGIVAVASGFGFGLLQIIRRTTFLWIDESKITRERYRRTVSVHWRDVKGYRLQGLEIEFETRDSTISANLDTIRVGEAPLLVRRGAKAIMTPLGVLFLQHVRGRARELPEIPISPSRRDRFLARIWTGVLIVVNVWMYILSRVPDGQDQFQQVGRLIDLGARTSTSYRGIPTPNSFTEPWRFLSALFLHNDIFHISVNMLVLASLASWLGRIYGWTRATIHYLLGGILGNVLAQAYVDFTTGTGMSLGASTAVMAMIGSLYGAVFRSPKSVPLAVRSRFRRVIPIIVLLTMGLGAAIQFMDNAAHLGGFIAGFALTWIVPPRAAARFERT